MAAHMQLIPADVPAPPILAPSDRLRCGQATDYINELKTHCGVVRGAVDKEAAHKRVLAEAFRGLPGVPDGTRWTVEELPVRAAPAGLACNVLTPNAEWLEIHAPGL